MCGIAGAVGLSALPPPPVADAILGSLAHRGPDRSGSWSDGEVWFGFRRLSILDLTEVADQPMVDPASGVAMVFNGEIYNFVELRRELEKVGHAFRSTGDTEVLLRAWLEWGESAFERCNGMWAVAIRDPRREGVVLARDRFGEKPLFYGRDQRGGWWFASEPGALRAAGVGSGRLDLTRAAGFLAFGDVDHPGGSWFAGIEQLPAGALLDLTPAGPRSPRRWWSLDRFVADRWPGPPATGEETTERLDAAVRLRLRSDVEVGTSLSGGIDSSTVVAAVRSVDPDRTVHTFTASFPGQPIDEWHGAEQVGTELGLTMHRVEPTVEGFAADLDRLVERQGGPIESPTVYAQWCVMRAAHDAGVTVLLDGQAADESWGGYLKYVALSVVGDLAALRPRRAASTIGAWRRFGDTPPADLRQVGALLLGGGARERAARYGAARGATLGPALAGVAVDDPFADPLGLPRRGPLLRRAAQADLSRVVLPRLLRYADRNSMAWSREVRLPFLDPSVLDVALRSRWADGLSQGWTKLALRRAGVGRLPESILWARGKVAYQTPDEQWLEHPALSEAVAAADRHLTDLGLLAARPASRPTPTPWRVLTLSRFVDRYGLVP